MRPQSLALGGLLVWGFSAADTSKESPDPFNAWLAKHAIRITTVEPGRGLLDLQPLKAVVGSARIVALGEATHGAHEFLAFRNRLFKFLVKEMGFTAIAVESGFSESTEVDDYVLGGVADKTKMARYVFAWAPIALRENLELIEWMRQYNARPSTSRKIRFYGIDLTGGKAGVFTDSRRALDAALAYLTRVAPELAQQARRSLERFLTRFNTDGYKNLAPDERDALTAAIGDLVSLFESQRIAFLARGPEADYHRAYRHAVVARQLDADFRAEHAGALQDDISPRDFAMADNVRWVLEREGPQGRILVFAHNFHVKKGPSRLLQMPEMEAKPPLMGEYLWSELGNQMVVLGSTASQGWFHHGLCVTNPSSIGGLLSRVGLPLFVLDLRACRGGPVAQAFNRVMNFWVNGTRHNGLNPAECFDALLFVKKLRGAKPIELGCFLGCFYLFFTCVHVGADLLGKFLTKR